MNNRTPIEDIPQKTDKESNKAKKSSATTILGEVPKDWNTDLVENIFILENGSAREDRTSSRNSSETEGRFDVYGANGKIAKYKESNLDKGLVIGRVGTVGSVYEINDHAWVSDNAIKAKLASENNLRFLYYVMKRGRIDSLANQTAHPLLNQGIVGSVRLPIPVLTEQCEIASVLYNVDQAIQKTEETIEQTRRVKKGLMQDLLRLGIKSEGSLRNVDEAHFQETHLGKLPSDWSLKRIEEVCSEVVDCPHSTPEYTEKGPLVVRTSEIRNGEFLKSEAPRTTKEDYHYRISRLKPRIGDVVFTREAPIGEAFKISNQQKICLGQRTMILRADRNKLDPDFLVNTLYSTHMQKRIHNLSRGSTSEHLNVGDVRKLQIPIPPIEEQKRITNYLENITKKIINEKSRKKQLQRIKNGLMQDLLTGKVRTKDKDIEILDEVLEVEKS